LTFLLGVFSLVALVRLAHCAGIILVNSTVTQSSFPPAALARIGLPTLTGLGIIALACYAVIWIPHQQLNNSMDFLAGQRTMLDSHRSVGGQDIHPYCSPWYTWPLMMRPVSYYYTSSLSLHPDAPEIVNDVHAMGNPVLWWLSSLALLALVLALLRRTALATSTLVSTDNRSALLQAPEFWIPLYILINYAVSLLPWLSAQRCTFLYHYMPAAVFSQLALAWLLCLGFRHRRWIVRGVCYILIALCIAAFAYWLPIYLGLPLLAADFHERMWFLSWY
jgi:dolichyl-phosphate-mannose--protein O-mannosyl transferase